MGTGGVGGRGRSGGSASRVQQVNAWDVCVGQGTGPEICNHGNLNAIFNMPIGCPPALLCCVHSQPIHFGMSRIISGGGLVKGSVGKGRPKLAVTSQRHKVIIRWQEPNSSRQWNWRLWRWKCEVTSSRKDVVETSALPMCAASIKTMHSMDAVRS